MGDDLPLVTDRLLLRRLTDADVDALVRYRSVPEVARYQGWEAPYPRERGARLVAELRDAHPDTAGAWFQLAVVRRDTRALVGDVGIQPEADDPRQVRIGYTLAPEHHGHGYATEAVTALLRWLFDERDKHRVTASCDARNAASIRLLERVGMRCEGRFVDSVWSKGEWCDDLQWAILAREWRARITGSPGRR